MTYSWQNPEDDRFLGKHETVAAAVDEYLVFAKGFYATGLNWPVEVNIGVAYVPFIETLLPDPSELILSEMNEWAREAYECDGSPFIMKPDDALDLSDELRDTVLSFLRNNGYWPPKFHGIHNIRTYAVQSDGSFAEVTP